MKLIDGCSSVDAGHEWCEYFRPCRAPPQGKRSAFSSVRSIFPDTTSGFYFWRCLVPWPANFALLGYPVRETKESAAAPGACDTMQTRRSKDRRMAQCSLHRPLGVGPPALLIGLIKTQRNPTQPSIGRQVAKDAGVVPREAQISLAAAGIPCAPDRSYDIGLASEDDRAQLPPLLWFLTCSSNGTLLERCLSIPRSSATMMAAVPMSFLDIRCRLGQNDDAPSPSWCRRQFVHVYHCSVFPFYIRLVATWAPLPSRCGSQGPLSA